MRLYNILYILVPMIVLSSCAKRETVDPKLLEGYPESFTLSVRNPIPLARHDAVFAMNVEELVARRADFNPRAFIVLVDGVELVHQGNDLDNDGEVDQIVCLSDFQPEELKEITIRFNKLGRAEREYSKRTQAELAHKTGGRWEDGTYLGGTFTNVRFLRVPDEHTDHSTFIRYEGPGWESDRVGYRFYLDWRNATDIFGKKVPDIVLQNVGQDGFDSYHEMADWGMDILKVGESLGLGSLGMWSGGKAERVAQTDSITCAIPANGPIRSIIKTQYYGWQVEGRSYDLTSELSIDAGSRLTRHDIQCIPNPQNLCTGIVKHPDAKLLHGPDTPTEWTYMATFGQQSLAGDDLGMAILFRRQDLVEITEDEYSTVTILEPKGGVMSYYFLAAWEQEPHGIQTEEEFIQYLEQVIAEISGPPEVVL